MMPCVSPMKAHTAFPAGSARLILTGRCGLLSAFGDIPFGGYKASGIGREWGIEGIEEFFETKMLAYPVAA